MRISLVATLLLLILAGPLLARDDPASSEELVTEAEMLRATGRYGDAEALLRKAPAGPEGAAALADLLLELGRIDEAQTIARTGRSDARCRTILAEALLRTGHPEEARLLLEKVLRAEPGFVRARYALGMALLELGDRSGALPAFEWLFTHYARNDLTDPEDLTLTAAASVRVAELVPEEEMDFKESMEILDTLNRDHPAYLPAYLVKGEIYLGAYQDMQAKKAYDAALKRNPRYPPALLGLAEQGAFRMNTSAGVMRCRDALLTNPNLVAAKEFIARVHLGDSRYEEAGKLIDEVLEVNPRRKPALSLQAALAYCRGQFELFESRVKRILELDPGYARVFWEMTLVLEQQRRFEEAAAFGERATKTDPADFRGWWAYGRNLVHLAKEGKAKEALEKSKNLDPFGHYLGNPFRENMAEVLGRLEEFVETRTPHFVYKIHVGENAVLARYYHRFMELSYRKLTEKYAFIPKGPILTEIFNDHRDFAARTIGLPGIGALGACFGQVITLDSPSARQPGEFGWASTAHHEFAHVITLQLSKGRVPRWLTEGLSVYEERKFADWWERDLDRRLFDAWSNNEIYGIEKFNSVFRGRDVLFAYYLGGMMCEFIEGEFGFPKIVGMLKAYGEDEDTAEVLQGVLGVSPKEFDQKFAEWVGDQVSGWKLVPMISSRKLKAARDVLEEKPKDMGALLTVAWAFFQRGNEVDALTYLGRARAVDADHPSLILLRGANAYRSGQLGKARDWYEMFLGTGGDDHRARLNLAAVYEKQGDIPAAMAHYEAAKTCFPRYSGPDGPYLNLARLKTRAEDLAGAMAELETHARLSNTDIRTRLKLAGWYESQGDWERLAAVLSQVVRIYPLGEELVMPVHVRLARACVRLDEFEVAALEFEVALELGVPEDEQSGVRLELGEVLLLLGQVDEARFHARTVLDADPANEAALDLLKRATGE